jgi:hypothetical protein
MIFIFTKFVRIPFIEKLLFLEAMATLLYVMVVIKLLPMRWYAGRIGKEKAETPIMDIADKTIIYKVSRSIIRCRKLVKDKNRCYPEAFTAKKMLKRRRLDSTLYIGVGKVENKITAHAWLRCGNIYVTGRRNMEKFTVVSTFA